MIVVAKQFEDRVMIEDPCYPSARAAFSGNGLVLSGLAVDGEGADIALAAPGARAIYVTPSHQFPLGVTMSMRRRLALIDWARETGGWIIEDDYDSEFHYAGKPTACVQGLDRHHRTLYVGTFGKTLYPGLRMGYMALPPELVGAFTRARSILDGHTPQTRQLTLARFMGDGHYGTHIRAMRKLYATRQAVMLDALDACLGEVVTPLRPPGGMQIPCFLKAGWSEAQTIRQAAGVGVHLPGLSRLYLGEDKQPGWLLGYACLTEHEIETAILALARALKA